MALLGLACREDPALRSGPPPEFTQADRAAFRTAIDAVRADAARLDDERQDAVRARGIAEPLQTGACPTTASSLLDLSLGPSSSTQAVAIFSLTEVLYLGGKNGSEGLLTRELKRSFDAAEERLAGGFVYPEPTGAAAVTRIAGDLRSALDARRHDLVLAVELLTQPRSNGARTFEAGQLVGRLFLWDRQAHRLVCAADVDGVGSATVHVRGVGSDITPEQMAGSALLGDLLVSTVLDGVQHLTALPSAPP